MTPWIRMPLYSSPENFRMSYLDREKYTTEDKVRRETNPHVWTLCFTQS
jgi:hypothetical protein